MARYSAFLGLPVEVQYRAGDMCLPAVGKLVGDSGRSIFLEQHYQQLGQSRNFSWEIPYSCVLRVRELDKTASLGEPELVGAGLSGGKSVRAKAARASAGPSVRR